MISFLSSFLYIFPDSKIMSSTCQKVKSCPRPVKKQNHVLDLSKSKIVSTTCRKAKVVPQPSENKILDKLPRTEKGISATPARDDPGSRKSLKTRLFQPPIMYFLSAILPSRPSSVPKVSRFPAQNLRKFSEFKGIRQNGIPCRGTRKVYESLKSALSNRLVLPQNAAIYRDIRQT